MAKTKQLQSATIPAPPIALSSATEITPEVRAWLDELIARADAGDEGASRALSAAYDAAPRLWRRLSGLQANAERSLLDLMAPHAAGRLHTRALLERQLAALREELLGPAPSALERLLVDRVVLCWLAAIERDTRHAQRRAAGGMTFREGEYHQRAGERAQRQFLRAVQTLATVRRLLVPAVQVNIADKQVNVAR